MLALLLSSAAVLSLLGQSAPAVVSKRTNATHVGGEPSLADLQAKSAKGDPKAQYELGHYYDEGEFMRPSDYDEAAKWYRKSADQGYAMAEDHLAYLYVQGWGVPRDLATAVQWYQKAAAHGNADAQVQLGAMYHTGSAWGGGIGIIAKDDTKALYWYRKAAAQGDSRGIDGLKALTATETSSQLEAQGLQGSVKDQLEEMAWKILVHANTESNAELQRKKGVLDVGFFEKAQSEFKVFRKAARATPIAHAKEFKRLLMDECATTLQPSNGLGEGRATMDTKGTPEHRAKWRSEMLARARAEILANW